MIVWPNNGGGGSAGFMVVGSAIVPFPLLQLKGIVAAMSEAIRETTMSEANIFLFMKLILLFDWKI